jgi:hypothetical protein
VWVQGYVVFVAEDLGCAVGLVVDVELGGGAAEFASGAGFDGSPAPAHVLGVVAVAVLPS